jgi:leucyl-tRNA synthetase
MWEKGLVFRKTANVNWCDTCNTVLANEQVSEGVCWRCKNPTGHKELEQWFIKITHYSDDLLEGMKALENGHWSEQVLSMQRNWIGKSFGAQVDFTLTSKNKPSKNLKIFTTRPDTLFGATFMVIAPEHSIISEMKGDIENLKEVEGYIAKSASKTNIERSQSKEKTGVELKGIKAVNPVNGAKIPVFVADYVLIDYGSGAIMAVPAHDQRDWEFAKKFNIQIIEVIKGENSSIENQAYEGDGELVNSGRFNGVKSDKAIEVVIDWISKEGFGKKTINYKFRDWLISRQRYWGTPIPMIHCQKCGILPVPEKDLPVVLPEDIEFSGDGESPLKTDKKFLAVKCPKCGADARRDTDTMDTFADSSWYFIRYCDAHNDDKPFDISTANYWMPADQYIGGIEHACMHLIYARFWHKFLRDLGMMKSDEPFTNLLTQGMVTLGGSAMSKSKGNVVSPDEIVDKYGADVLRLFILFAAPPSKQLDWSTEGLEGCFRFVNRVWRLMEVINVKAPQAAAKEDKEKLLRTMHQSVKKVSADIEKKLQFNTVISTTMELVNALYLYKFHSNDDDVSKRVYKTTVLLLSPIIPHLCEEIWSKLGEKTYCSLAKWPDFDESAIQEAEIELPIQINGKVRARINIPAEISQDEVRALVEKDERVLKFLEGKKIVKFIYVKGKIATLAVK